MWKSWTLCPLDSSFLSPQNLWRHPWCWMTFWSLGATWAKSSRWLSYRIFGLKTSTNHILPILHQHASVVESGCLRGLWCRPLWFVVNLWLTTNQKYHKGGQLKSCLRQKYENISCAAKRKEMWNGGDAFASFELNLVFKSFCIFVFSSSEHLS